MWPKSSCSFNARIKGGRAADIPPDLLVGCPVTVTSAVIIPHRPAQVKTLVAT
jgi:hypothetical protein